MLKVAIIGEYVSDRPSHCATENALKHSSQALGLKLQFEWIATDALDKPQGLQLLDPFDALFVAPGGPFKSMEGSLHAIRFARERHRALLGTCGGFQLVVVEYARNVLGIADAEHAETAPQAARLIITPLSCSIAGKTFAVDLVPGSRAHRAYQAAQVKERYHCMYGVNPAYRSKLENAGLGTTGLEAAEEGRGQTRIMELDSHPFYMATLFVPQMRSTPELPHPLIDAFLLAMAGRQ